MMIYIAGPNDLVENIEQRRILTQMREYVRLELGRHLNLAGFDPTRPYVEPQRDGPATWRINEAALRESDAVLALLPAGIATVGTPMEIQSAWKRHKPVAAVGGAGSMQLVGMRIPHFEWSAAGVEQAIKWIRVGAFPGALPAAKREPVGSTLKWVGEERYEPRRAFDGDAGFDLVCSEPVMVRPGDFVDIPCGIAVEMPPGTWGLVVGRSSTLRKRGLFVPPGVIDNGWRGGMFAGTWNLGDKLARVERGDRIAQLIPMPLVAPGLRLARVEELAGGDRGERGFGSTGN